MKNDEVLYHILRLPEQSPLIEWVRREHFAEMQFLPPEARRWYAYRDAALGWNLTFAYFYAGQELPREITWSAARRAFQCLTNPQETQRTDSTCHEVLAFGHPINRRAQANLKGYLAARISYGEIAARVGKSVEFVRLYANLFFDFRERCESPEFVEAVLDPQGERGCFQTDLSYLIAIEDPGLRLANIGFFYSLEVLVEAIGRASDGNTLPGEADFLKNINRWLLLRANRKAMVGQLESGDPEFNLTKTLNQWQKQHPNSNNSQAAQLEFLSISGGAQSTLDAMFQQQITGQLQALAGGSAPEEPDYQI